MSAHADTVMQILCTRSGRLSCTMLGFRLFSGPSTRQPCSLKCVSSAFHSACTVHTPVCMCVCMCVRLCVYVCVSARARLRASLCVRVCVCMCVCARTCVCVCVSMQRCVCMQRAQFRQPLLCGTVKSQT